MARTIAPTGNRSDGLANKRCHKLCSPYTRVASYPVPRPLRLVSGIVARDDVGMFRETLGVLELPLEIGETVCLADGLDRYSLSRHDVIYDPRRAVRTLTGLLQESEVP